MSVSTEDIIQELVDGRNMTEISIELGCDLKTVHSKLERARQKYGAKTTAHLVALLVAKREYLPKEIEGVEVA